MIFTITEYDNEGNVVSENVYRAITITSQEQLKEVLDAAEAARGLTEMADAVTEMEPVEEPWRPDQTYRAGYDYACGYRD